jgi:hypothetical protein
LEILFKLSEKSVIFFKDAKFPGFPFEKVAKMIAFFSWKEDVRLGMPKDIVLCHASW